MVVLQKEKIFEKLSSQKYIINNSYTRSRFLGNTRLKSLMFKNV